MRDDQVLLGAEDNPCPRPPILFPSLGATMPPLGPLGALGVPPYYYYHPYFSHATSQLNAIPQLSALSSSLTSSISSSLASSLASSLLPSPLRKKKQVLQI